MAESKFYLAIDIGASSGRHILGWLENGKIRLEELYRFENKLVKKNGHLCWDLEHLFQEVMAGLKKCRELERIPASIGIDTWGVDFVLLDKAGIPTKIFGKLNMPKTVVGEFSEEISQDRFLNALIATETGKRVFAGPIEATAVGNLMAQMLKDGVFADLDEARKVVAKSFDVSEVEESWFSKFTAVCSFSLAQRNEPKK